MLFNSLIFVLFALLFYPLYYLIPRQRGRLLLLTAFSFYFYSYWDWRFLFLLLATGLTDFYAALAIVRYPAWKRTFLILSMSSNLVTLGFFKYFGFFVENLDWLARSLGMGVVHVPLEVILPIGISFYTFASMSYTIDVYRGEFEPTKDPVHFFAFLAMFPHLVAGPIVRGRVLLPQLVEKRNPTAEQWWDGWYLITKGFFKKCFIADNLAISVNAAFGSTSVEQSALYWWVVVCMFAVQIYADFSGYSDIALGLAKWMGVEFPLNFDHPYISRSFREFWNRWHITLSHWFRDYVYVTAGGNRHGWVRGLLNLWLTMLLSGLWHGASWTFVIWGGLHAAYLTLERVFEWPRYLQRYLKGFGVLLAVAIVFLMTLISWVFFRAQSLDQAMAVLGRMVDFSTLADVGSLAALPAPKVSFLILALVFARHLYVGLGLRHWSENWLPMTAIRVATAALLIQAAVFMRGPGSAFIYFQF